GLHSRSPWKGRVLLDLGVSAGIAKITDDSIRLAIELVVAGATDACTAGVGRIAAAAMSGLFLLTRHGRDVVLPRYTEMEVTFSRPVLLRTGAKPRSDKVNSRPEP